MARILIVEDEKDLQEVLSYNLRQAGHTPLIVGAGRDAIGAVTEHRPDLVLLDLMLPDVSGVEICRRLKGNAATKDIPIVMVTAKGDEIDRVVGFELGADDYVVKPYSLRELLLRVEAVLRRTAPAPPGSARGVLVFGKLRVDRDAHRVWVDGDEVTLTALELRLLSTLMERRGRVQSRPALLDDVWGMSGEVTTRTVDTHVKRLREKLGGRRAVHRDRARRRLPLHASARSCRRHGRGPRRRRAMKLNIRGKLFAVSLALIGVSLLAGELYLRPSVEANLLDRIRGDLLARLSLVEQAARGADRSRPRALGRAGRRRSDRARTGRVTFIDADGVVLGDSRGLARRAGPCSRTTATGPRWRRRWRGAPAPRPATAPPSTNG